MVIRAAKVYTMAGEPLQPGAVLIRDGKIVQAAASIDVPAGAQVVDLGQGVLMPGLVDSRAAVDVVAGSSEVTREVTPDFQVLTAMNWESRGFQEALSEGITCLHLTPGSESVLAGISSAVKTAGDRNERIVAPEAGIFMAVSSDPTARNRSRARPDSIYVRQPTNRMGVVWILRSTLQAARKSMRQSDELLAAGNGNGSSAPTTAQRSVIERALSGELRVLAVSRAHYDMTSALDVAREFDFPITIVGGHESYRLAEQLAQGKVPVILDPLTTGAMIGPDDTELFWNVPGKLHQAGVLFALSGGRLLEQAQFAVRFGLPVNVALESVTIAPAKILGLENRVGAVVPGRDADLVALSGEPLEVATSIRWVMVNGKIYNKDNEP
jgi:imidazolonepropionase-like amidohydrolase